MRRWIAAVAVAAGLAGLAGLASPALAGTLPAGGPHECVGLHPTFGFFTFEALTIRADRGYSWDPEPKGEFSQGGIPQKGNGTYRRRGDKVKFVSGPFDENGFKWKGRVVTHGVLGIAIKLKPRRGSLGGGTQCELNNP